MRIRIGLALLAALPLQGHAATVRAVFVGIDEYLYSATDKPQHHDSYNPTAGFALAHSHSITRGWPLTPTLSAHEFVAKWRKTDLSERRAAQQHFLDLCRLLDHAAPAVGRGGGRGVRVAGGLE